LTFLLMAGFWATALNAQVEQP